MKFSLNSNGKINIGLNVTGVLPNGYHLLDMIMIPISLSDKITGEIEDISGTLEIKTNKADIPVNEDNILWKIYDKFYNESGISKRKISLYLEKIIPHQAGLGGGSSNGAFLLKLLNEFHGNFFSQERLIEIGKSVGADIPFFLINRSARVRGIGEDIEIIENNLKNSIILIKPQFGVSTGKAYKNMSMLNNKRDANIDKIIFGLKENRVDIVEDNIENHLEQGLLLEDENIIEFRKKLAELNMKFFMSGSGSAYYTFVTQEESEEAVTRIKEYLNSCEVYLCSSL
ncbi:MAG: 4-(cytidine 5'-diphospho)-2-C-methyl-D-erythritol kinase [Fusobacterium sp.]|uniref:4-(cytidine 5'-diphospho)-2-C-methyl-D-erythritol kinase n=1 Tax=Fusobacterium sp. TaxID=68766 RepID=UPI002941E68C|nr:4-(cytidine 5'-diphospho)-2-C-methyl-D-erythritol kinase [Fusobacterium sp.]MDY3059924.1 4-(cytidine 5'-diphospho)-2-C-methyl-D-erythritol kinase [Fusobacterium sp.]MEE1476957.1 4-(cytidine 5'-diphospho)-2-C-methyl-D-erythritol kinase [Fusobacterium sp.]